MAKGAVEGLVAVREYDRTYLADVLEGQKTGWFYDQRDNREMVAGLAKGKSVLDVFCHTGGFGIAAGLRGADSVGFVDSSAWALDIAKQAADANGVSRLCDFIQGSASRHTMERLHKEKRAFDIVVADPPAFIPSRKDLARGLAGYEKNGKTGGSLSCKRRLFVHSVLFTPCNGAAVSQISAGGNQKGRKEGRHRETNRRRPGPPRAPATTAKRVPQGAAHPDGAIANLHASLSGE